MTRARRTDLWLLALAVVLLVVWFVGPRSSSDDQLPGTDWSDLVTDPPQTFEIRRTASHLLLKYQQDPSTIERYTTQSELGAHTDPAVVDRLLLALSRLEIVRRVDGRANELGLEQPALEIEMSTRKGKRRVALGKPAAAPRNARYAAVTDTDEMSFVVLAASSVEAIDIDPTSLLDARVFDLTPSEVRELKWSTHDASKRLIRTEDGHWRHDTSQGARVRRNTLERLLSNLTELKLSKHLSPSVAAATLRSSGSVAELTLNVTRDDRSRVLVLRAGGTCPGSKDALGLTLEGERPVSGCVERQSFDTLLAKPSTLIDDGLFSLHTDEVERLVVANSTRNFTLTRDGSEFQLDGSSKSKLALAAGNGLIDSVISLRGDPVGVCDSDARLDQPVLKLESYLIGDVKTTEQVRIGPIAADGSRTICRDDGVELMLTAWAARLLELSEPSSRSTALLDLPIDAVSKIRIGKEHSESWLFRANAEHRFVLVEPRTPTLDAATVERLREQVASLDVTRWLLPSDPKSFGVGLRSLTLNLELIDEATRDGGAPPRSPQRRLYVLLPSQGEIAIGWLDREPTPLLLDSAFAQVLNEVAKAMEAASTR